MLTIVDSFLCWSSDQMMTLLTDAGWVALSGTELVQEEEEEEQEEEQEEEERYDAAAHV